MKVTMPTPAADKVVHQQPEQRWVKNLNIKEVLVPKIITVRSSINTYMVET